MGVVPIHGRRGAALGKPAERPQLIAALDVGSTKVCCLIAEVMTIRNRTFGGEKTFQLKVAGVGHQAAQGVRQGAVVDLEAAERAIRLAVDAAERMAGVRVEQVYVNVSGGRPQCQGYAAEIKPAAGAIGEGDLDRVMAQAQARIPAGERVLLHTAPVQYTLDGQRGVRDPRGMFAERLAVELNAITAEPGPMRNLMLAVERCHLRVAGFVLAPYAAGRSVLVEDETALGVTCVDMGGGTTTVAVFVEGHLAHADAIALGGQHITRDIAKGLSTTLAHAERMKTLYGSALASVCDEREIIAVPLVGERGTDTVNRIPRSMLTGIVRPRIEETFELIRDRLQASPAGKLAGRRLVLTGGASQITGAREVAGQILDKNVRLGFPRPVTGMPDAARTPAFAVAEGLLEYALAPDPIVVALPGLAGRLHGSGTFARLGQWIRESF